MARVDSWSCLQVDLLCLVGEKIESIEDFHSFCGVCRFWYVAGAELYRQKMKFKLISPVFTPGFDPHCPKSNFTTLHDYMAASKPRTRVSWWQRFTGSPPLKCWGSQFGWLVTYSPREHEFGLVNPVSGATITLPPFDLTLFDLEHPGWIKAFLMADPDVSPDDCILIVSHGFSPLAFIRPTETHRVWQGIHHHDTLYLVDVMSFRGGLYALIDDGPSNAIMFHVCLIKIKPSPVVEYLWPVKIGPRDPALGIPGRDLDVDDFTMPWTGDVLVPFHSKYMVELEGEFCVVLRYMFRDANRAFSTGYFKVFRVDMSTRKVSRVWSLGDRCLFLGNGNTFTCKLSNYYSMSNLVFYTHADDIDMPFQEVLRIFNKRPRRRDEGVWDMLSSEIVYSTTDHRAKYQSSLWFLPSPNSIQKLAIKS